MSKSVLISIKPKWVEKIASGEKTIEVRKSRPKIETPFKCYIYCTINKKREVFFSKEVFDGEKGKWAIPHVGNGKVIGEFVCDWIDDLRYVPTKYCLQPAGTWEDMICNNSCLSFDQIKEYAKGKTIYGWHISDLKIYDKPKELSEFVRHCRKDEPCIFCEHLKAYGCENWTFERLTRPPQSWQYVEVDV